MFVGSIQIHQKFQNFIDDFIRTGFRTVDLIDTYDHVQIQFQRFFQNEFGLRHSTFERIYDQDNTVYHLQDTFYFAAEVRMTWSVDDVDLGIFVINSCIFGKNRDTTFPLDIVGVHDTFLDFLIRTEYTALTQ